jgi:glycosyltransferase involved in cell wall biosynthesis
MKLLFLTTEDSSFWSHRLQLAHAARKEGADVVIMTRSGAYRSQLEREGFRVIVWSISRKSLNPIRELRSFIQVLSTYRAERPDLVHHIALKPIVYGTLASRLCGGIASVNTLTGLGPVFTRTNMFVKVLRIFVTKLLRMSFGAVNGRVIVQNENDRELLIREGIAAEERTAVIPGFGVDTEQFMPRPERGGDPLVMLPARMLWEKGVREFVEAARELRERGINARMVLVGAPDPNNPGCISEQRLREWAKAKSVEWWGHQTDMPAILCQAHLVCLPSYREGCPKVLLEASACGRAVVTTDVPGCRQAVAHEVNGLLVPARDAKALGAAIERLLKDPELRRRLGARGRERAVNEFSHSVIVSQMMGLYEKLLEGKWSRTAFQSSEEKAEALTEA